MKKSSNAYERESQLVRELFDTPKGRELLELWTNYYVKSPVFDPSATVMAARVGKLEFVTGLINCLEGDNL